MAYLLTVAGGALLFAGGEFLVRGAVAISRRLGISPLLIGLTVVALCTSAPELLVSVRSALAGSPDVAVGNVVGSNIANIALILGLASMIKPPVVDRTDIRYDALVMVGSAAVLVALGLTGMITRFAGAVFLAALATYIFLSYRAEVLAGTVAEDWHAEEVREIPPSPSAGRSALFMTVGLAALVVGANWLIEGASAIATAAGVSDAVVGLTVVAIGTSLPELATSAIAAYRGHPDVAVGNVLGSNVFNILAIAGTTAVISPLSVSTRLARVDMPIMLALSIVAAAILLRSGRVGRMTGALLLGAYVAYVAALYL